MTRTTALRAAVALAGLRKSCGDVRATVSGHRQASDLAKAPHPSEGTVRNHLSAAIGKTGADQGPAEEHGRL